MNPLAPFLEKYGFAMLDGGLSTQLERLGANMEGELWTSRVLVERPDLLQTACQQFLESGADVVATATYQASVDGFLRAGLKQEQARTLMRKAIELAVSARDEFWSQPGNRAGRLRPLVAASLGPYGACLHDGSEYHGNYAIGPPELVEFHRQRIGFLADAGADIFAFETFPSLLEAQAVFEVLPKFPEITAWISFSCRDDQHVAHGESFAECAALAAQQEQIVAVGVNCLPPENVTPLLKSAEGCGLPLAVYPNSGEYWDAEAQQWRGQVCGGMDVGAWHRHGARLIGGCCRTDSDDIRGMRASLEAALR
jgi:homocysteine S-methyltransferase